MKVEIWSDVVCPFCYIGKRHFEAALKQTPFADQIEVEWHSFLLDPNTPTDANLSVYEYLAQRKGVSVEQSKQMHEHVTSMAKQAGLEYNYDKAIVANTFNAHRLIQMAKTHKLDDVVEELLFKAYFTEGKNIGKNEVLTEIGLQAGLRKEQIDQALTDDEYSLNVWHDVKEAQAIDIHGVPFFVFDRSYGVSGAQPVGAFTDVLKRSFTEWQQAQQSKTLQVENGESCNVDGECV